MEYRIQKHGYPGGRPVRVEEKPRSRHLWTQPPREEPVVPRLRKSKDVHYKIGFTIPEEEY